MTDSNDNQKDGHSDEAVNINDKETVRPVSARQPSASVSSLPPSIELEVSDETPAALLVDDDLIDDDDEPTQNISVPPLQTDPPRPSRPAPLGVKSRFSTAPPKQSLAGRHPPPPGPREDEPAPGDSAPVHLDAEPIPLDVAATVAKAPVTQPASFLTPKVPSLPPPPPRAALAPKRLSPSLSASQSAHRAASPSLVVRPLSSRPPQEDAPLECPSAERLAQNGRVESWLSRASGFEAHANTLKDAVKKGRLLVLASELYAMAGHVTSARAVAERAAKLGNHLAQRQSRQLAQVAGDAKATQGYFSVEASTAVTAATRRHVLVTHSEFERWSRKDSLTSSRLLEQVPRIAPTDPLPPLMKVARAMAQEKAASPLAWPAETDAPELATATQTARRLRGDSRVKAEGPLDPVSAFLEVRRALERRDRVAAASALLELKEEPGFQRAAPWLASALLAPTATTRRRAAELLERLQEQRGSKAVDRALLARRLELGDDEAVQTSLNHDATKPAGERSFTSAEHLALGALCQSSGTLPQQLSLSEVGKEDQPLVAATALSADRSDLAGALGDLPGAVVDLAHRLARGEADAKEGTASHPLVTLVRLGNQITSEAHPPSPADLLGVIGLTSAGASGQLSFAAAMLAESQGASNVARDLFEAAASDSVCGEAALRILLRNSEAEDASRLLETFGQELANANAKAAALVHAALLTEDTDRQIHLCSQAHAAAPDHVLVEAAVFRLVAPIPSLTEPLESVPPPATLETSGPPSSNLASKRLAILSHQSINGDNDYLRALALLRHVFTKPSAATRPTLLSHAWDLWPKDVALLELRERSGELPLDVRAKARETLLSSVSSPRSGNCLRTEAAFFYELAGLPSSAARVAHPREQPPPLLAACFGRNAPGTEFAGLWRQQNLERAQNAAHSIERAHHWLQVARLASDAGDWAAEREAIGRAIHLDPQSIEALLSAEALAFKDGEVERIAEVERLLAEALRSPDQVAHAQLAARFLQLSSGGTSSYAALCACIDDARTPLDVVRRLAYQAPRMGDDELGYRMYAQLLGAVSRPQDKAALLMRCAEIALRLGKAAAALAHLDDAIALAPNWVSALSLRAEVLAGDGYPAAAAEGFERLAAAAESPALRSAAYKRAAEQLLAESGGSASESFTVHAPGDARNVADPRRLRVNLERSLEANPDDAEALDLLINVYVQMRLDGELGELFLRRLKTTSPESRHRLLLKWSEACLTMGSSARAFELVREVLKQQPDNPAALEQLASLTPDADEREHALLQLIRVSPAPERQASAYKQLGEFYRGQPGQAIRAARCYQEALKRTPDDAETFRALVDAQIGSADLNGAQAAIEAFAGRATTDADKRIVAIAAAALAGAHSPEQGETQLLELLAERPFDTTVLGELSQLYVRAGNSDKLERLTEQVREQAERELPSGPHVTQYLSALDALAKLRGDNSAQLLIAAMSSLYHGAPSGLDARGSRAISRALDALLAPAPLGEPLRTLLARTSDALEEAFPLNIADLNPVPLREARLRASFDMKAKAVGITAPELLSIAGAPYLCMVTHRPARVFLGSGWVEDCPAALQDFVVWRSLKLLQARLGPMAHLTPDAAALRLDALISAYADPGDTLLGADAEPNRLRSLLHPLVPKDATLGPLATASVAELSSTKTEIGDAIALWANRCALLATGDPRLALTAVCLMHGESQTHSPGELVAAAHRQPNARRLLLSLLEPAFIEAHRSIH